MVWIHSQTEVARHPKTRRAARDLRVSLVTMVGHLHLLWYFAAEFTPDGNLSRFTYSDIAEACGWTDDARTFVQVLVNTGFLDDPQALDQPREAVSLSFAQRDDTEDEYGVCIHDWDAYQGRLNDARVANAARQKQWRDRQRDQAAPSVPARNGYVTGASNARNGLDKIRQDKIRREKREHARDAREAAPAASSLSLLKAETTEPEPEPEPDAADLQALHEAFADALGIQPQSHAEVRKWRDGVRELAARGIRPRDAPQLVDQYRAKFGDTIPCHPKAIADNYGSLTGASNGHAGAVQQHRAAKQERDAETFSAELVRLGIPAAQATNGRGTHRDPGSGSPPLSGGSHPATG